MSPPQWQWLLRTAQRLVRFHMGGVSPLKAILALWSFFRRQFERYSCILHDRARRIHDGDTCVPPRDAPNDFTMTRVDGAIDEETPDSIVVCCSVVPRDASESIYNFSVENGSRSSLDTVTTFATPMASRSQVNLADYAHVNLLTRCLPRQCSRPPLIVQLPTDQNSPYSYSYPATSRSSQNVCHSMPNLGTYTHESPFSHQLSRLRPTSMIGTQSCPSFNNETSTVIIQPLPSDVPHDGPDVTIPGDVTTLMSAYPLFWPIAPEEVKRYEREIVEQKETDYWIDPLTTSFKPDPVPDEWATYVHPEGARYFVRQRKVSPCTGNYHDAMIYSGCLLPRIFTDINIYDSDKLELITKFMVDMEDYIRAKGINMHPNVDLVFDLKRDPENGDICCAYYFASHDDRSIFWFDNFNATCFNSWYVKGITFTSHVGCEVESQYWHHCQHFPTCREMDMNTINELRDILIHCIGDLMTSKTADCPYDVSDLQQILSLTNSIRETSLSGDFQSPSSVSSISRFMHIFAQQRFYNFHGFNCDKPVHGIKPKRILLSSVLFYAPDIYLDSLNKIWDGGLLTKTSWTIFVDKLEAEWQDLILNSTVLLNANVAFLAIQSVDDSSANGGRSPVQVLSYISIIASIGSIIWGLLLIRRNRWMPSNSPVEAGLGLRFRVLNSRKQHYTDLERLAIMYSMPYALLMWAMIAFLLAFSLVCFSASDVAIRMLVGTTWLAITALISCLIVWEGKQSDYHWYKLLSSFGTKIRERLPRAPSVHVVEIINSLNWSRTRGSVDSEEMVA